MEGELGKWKQEPNNTYANRRPLESRTNCNVSPWEEKFKSSTDTLAQTNANNTELGSHGLRRGGGILVLECNRKQTIKSKKRL